MADISLSAAVRQSLLSLQSTTDVIERTQNRLSTGLKVASATDDPVAFFQAKTLSDRAFDFTEKKDGIDQGISTVTAAIDGLDAVESLVRQLKGIANSMKSSTGTQFTDLITQYNDLRSQIDLMTADSTYQGVNLINGTGQTLSTEFSDLSTSKLTVSSVDVTANGLDVGTVSAINTSSSRLNFSYGDFLATTWTVGSTTGVSITYVGDTVTLTSASGTKTFSYGTVSVTMSVSAGAPSSQNITLTNGTTYTLNLVSGTTARSNVSASGTTLTVEFTGKSAAMALSATSGKSFVQAANSTSIDAIITDLSTALTTLRSKASSLGSNVALLNTRLDFTQKYVNTLDSGSSKLTLADINEEGANLLALQTRQQLGIQALSFAGQAEQSVLGLFR
ncbi:MAG: hypothetical protein HQL35_01400 [Alphaproteobacteria bacterium]|nr:hypothetical protein [Alphaproteobacteria bacterium]